MGKRNSCKSKAGRAFRSPDIFGKPININFKGEEQFKTSLGAILSMVWGAALILYILGVGYQIVLKEKQKQEELTVETQLKENVQAKNMDFLVAFTLNKIDSDTPISIEEAKSIYNINIKATNVFEERIQELEIDSCEEATQQQFGEFPSMAQKLVETAEYLKYKTTLQQKFPEDSPKQSDELKDVMYCINPDSLRFQGIQRETIWEYLKIEIIVTGRSAAQEITFLPYILEQKFDSNNYESPIKNYLNQPFLEGINILGSAKQLAILNLGLNTLKLEKQLIQYGQAEEYQFLSSRDTQIKYVGNKSAKLVTLQIGLGKYSTYYSLKTLSIQDGIAYIFALFGALYYVLSLLMMGIPSAIYKAELIQRLYKTPIDAGKQYEKESSGAIKTENENQQDELINMFRSRDDKIFFNEREAKFFTKKSIMYQHKHHVNCCRMFYVYGMSMVSGMFACCCVSSRNIKASLDKGLGQIQQATDITRLTRVSIVQKLILKVLFNEKERMLIRYQDRLIPNHSQDEIWPEDSSGRSEGEGPINPFVSYKYQLDETHKELLRGMLMPEPGAILAATPMVRNRTQFDRDQQEKQEASVIKEFDGDAQFQVVKNESVDPSFHIDQESFDYNEGIDKEGGGLSATINGGKTTIELSDLERIEKGNPNAKRLYGQSEIMKSLNVNQGMYDEDETDFGAGASIGHRRAPTQLIKQYDANDELHKKFKASLGEAKINPLLNGGGHSPQKLITKRR